jgi:hypothetical protein
VEHLREGQDFGRLVDQDDAARRIRRREPELLQQAELVEAAPAFDDLPVGPPGVGPGRPPGLADAQAGCPHPPDG